MMLRKKTQTKLVIVDQRLIYHSHRATEGDAAAGEGRSEAAGPLVSLGPGEANGAVDQGIPGRVKERRPLQEAERRERRVVSWILGQIIDVSLWNTHGDANVCTVEVCKLRMEFVYACVYIERGAAAHVSYAFSVSESPAFLVMQIRILCNNNQLLLL